MIALAALILLVEAARHHRTEEAALLLGLLIIDVSAGRWLARDLRVHPANFPAPSPAHGLGLMATGAAGRRPSSRWPSQNRTGG